MSTCPSSRSSEASNEMEELAKASANPDEIELGDSGGEEEEGPQPEPSEEPRQQLVLEEQVIPSAVFGSISEEMQGSVLGARQRFNLGGKN